MAEASSLNLGYVRNLTVERLPSVPLEMENDVWVLEISGVDVGGDLLFGSAVGFGVIYYPTYPAKWSIVCNETINTGVDRIVDDKVTITAGPGSVWLKSEYGLWSTTGTMFPRYSNDASKMLRVGTMSDQNGNIYSQRRGTNKIYRFSRMYMGLQSFDLVPCVMGGVPGMYDMVSGTFCSSTASTPFTAGPRCGDDGQPL